MRATSLRRAGPGTLAHAAACAGAVLLLAAGAARADRFADVSVVLQPIPSPGGGGGYGGYSGYSGTSHGYVEYRAMVTNYSMDKDRQVKLILPANSYGRNGDRIRQVSRSIRVAPGATVSVSLFQPPIPIFGDDLAVEIDGRRQDRTLGLSRPRHCESSPEVAVLVSRRAGDSGIVSQALASFPSSGTAYRTELPPNTWSTDWLGYSCYDLVVATDRDMQEAPSEVRLALRRYVQAGGVLAIQGTIPAFLQEGAWPDGRNGARLGFGAVVQVGPQLGWGLITGAPRISGSFDSDEANNRFPVASDIRVPVRGLFILMLLFAVVFGPVNLWLLSVWKKRIWLLWNVPAASLLTCAMVFLYAASAEGWTGRMKTWMLTVLDENTHQAASFGMVGLYCPVAPGDGLHFEYDTEVSPATDRYGSAGRPRTIDWSSGQHLQEGWVSSRIPAHFAVRKSQDRRERLTMQRRPDGTITVVNALGANIKSLYLADADGQVYHAAGIPAGAESDPLYPTGKRAAAPADVLWSLYRSEWAETIKALSEDPVLRLRPGTYAAVLDSAVFLEDPLPRAKKVECTAVVYGILQRSADGG